MELNCLPRHCPCGNHPTLTKIPDGLTHRPGATCRFQLYLFPRGMRLRSCCSFDAEDAVRDLRALGARALAVRLLDDLTAEDAVALAEALYDATDRIENAHRTIHPKPDGGGRRGWWDATRSRWVWTEHAAFEQALANIRLAAFWYEKIGALGFGVESWW